MDYFANIMQVIERAKAFGYREVPNGARLYGHVPHVGPEGWLHQVHAPLDSNGIKAIEELIENKLSTSLSDFLMKANGCHLFSGSLSINGLRKDYSRKGDDARQPFNIATKNTVERPVDADPAFIFFGFYEWDGSRLFIDPRSDKVFRCSKKSSAPLDSWPGFWEMLDSEVNRLAALYDSTGHKLDPKAPTTP